MSSCVRAVVLLTDAAGMKDVALAPGMRLYCYETLLAEADEDYAWPEFDENTASALCYTSGTTGRPKGVLYSHRATMLHTYAGNSAEMFGIRSVDRILPAASMYHACAWGLPYCATMVGAALILPGRHLDGASLYRMLESERVTMTAGVPTIWLGLLAHLRGSNERLTHLKRMLVAGSALPRLLVEEFTPMGVNVEQGWGMTETSPIVTYNSPTPASAVLTGEDAIRQRLKQGRAACGTDMKIVDAEGCELPWDGKAFGDFLVRGHWVCREYLNRGAEGAADSEGWLRTGDVCTIDPDGCAEIVDRSKDVIKSGGEWISSIALENIAVSHPAVAEAAIIAARHPKWQERPLLLVVPRAGMQIDKDELLAHVCRQGGEVVASRRRADARRAAAYGDRQAQQARFARALPGPLDGKREIPGLVEVTRLPRPARSSAANSSSESLIAAAPTFSSRCATLPVPGIGSMTGLRFKSQASAIWPGLALCLCAIASNAEPGRADAPASSGAQGMKPMLCFSQ